MAIKNISVKLNGGDAVTVDGDLEFQLLGSATQGGTYTALTECTYIKLGSENTSGTSSSTISISSDVATIGNADIGSAEWLKCQVKDEADNESLLSAELPVNAVDYKLLFNDAQGQYIYTTAYTMPTSKLGMEFALPDGLSTGDKITLASVIFSPLNATEIFIGLGGGFDVYTADSATLAAASSLSFTYDVTTFDTVFKIDGAVQTLVRTQGTKGTPVGGALGIFIDQSSADVSISYLKLYDDTTLLYHYKMDEGAGTTLIDTMGSKNSAITVGTGSIDTVWVAI